MTRSREVIRDDILDYLAEKNSIKDIFKDEKFINLLKEFYDNYGGTKFKDKEEFIQIIMNQSKDKECNLEPHELALLKMLDLIAHASTAIHAIVSFNWVCPIIYELYLEERGRYESKRIQS